MASLAISILAACGGGGESDEAKSSSNEPEKTAGVDGVPAAPTGVTASDSAFTDTIKVTFTAPNQTKHCAAVSYVVLRDKDEIARVEDVPLAGGVRSVDDRVGGAPDAFVYSVVAVCPSNGAQAASPPDTGTTSVHSITGVVAPLPAAKSALVYAYNAQGKRCSNFLVQLPNSESGQINYQQYAVSDSEGKFTFSVDPAKCMAPIVLHADIPDGNDAADFPESPNREGRKYYNFVSELFNGVRSYDRNLNPSTALVASIVAGRVPVPGEANPKTVYNEIRRESAANKVREGLDALAKALGTEVETYASPAFEASSPLVKIFSVLNVAVERLTSAKQTVIRFHIPSEHRPLALVLTDGDSIEQGKFDTGLGVDTNLIDQARFRAAQTLQSELSASVGSMDVMSVLGLRDNCFLHNGEVETIALVGNHPGWENLGAKIENIQLLRLNTYSDFSNETLEYLNPGPATLAFVAIDFRNAYGLKERSYTWLIKGAQDLAHCPGAGHPTEWRVLGNQRPVYLRTDTIAVHEISYSQGFGNRKDLYGSGTEHFIDESPWTMKTFTHVLINGPGLPTDGVLLIKQYGAFLYATTSLKNLRQSAIAATSPDWFKGIANFIKDTRAYMMTDASIKTISDTYYDFRQNGYVYRFFADYADLYPALVLQDTLPKRPYLSTELPVDYFHSVGLNIDNLVQAMQRQDPVTINWSIPNDYRGAKMIPRKAWFSRMNCTVSTQWPACSDRNNQYNEYDLSQTYFPVASGPESFMTQVTLTPGPFPFPGLYTNKAWTRVVHLDSLNRPIETRLGMDYTR